MIHRKMRNISTTTYFQNKLTKGATFEAENVKKSA